MNKETQEKMRKLINRLVDELVNAGFDVTGTVKHGAAFSYQMTLKAEGISVEVEIEEKATPTEAA